MASEIVILGGGVIGSSVAYHLAKRGIRDIVVLDRGSEPGSGSTGKATGGFRSQFDNEMEIRLSLLAREKLIAFEEETGVDSGYRPHGYLFLACTDAELGALREANELQRAIGVDDARIVSAQEARALNPAVGDTTVAGGSFCQSDGFIRPLQILRGYIDAAKRLGVRFEFGTEHDGFTTSNDRIVAARTSAGDVRGRLFVNALGAWSGAPVVPLRRNVAATAGLHGLEESMPMTICWADWYHLRVRDGRVLLLWPDDPIVDDDTWLEEVLRMTRGRVPCLAEARIEERWSGFYEMSPDGHAILGRSPSFENLYLATGCSGHGVMHSPALGQLLAEMIVDGSTSIDVSALSPGRFPVEPR